MPDIDVVPALCSPQFIVKETVDSATWLRRGLPNTCSGLVVLDSIVDEELWIFFSPCADTAIGVLIEVQPCNLPLSLRV